MNRSLIKPIAAIANAAVLVAGIASLAAAAEPSAMAATAVSPKQEFSAMQHEFQLESGEKLLLFHRKRPSAYRVCVDTFKGAVPLKVIIDGTESVVGVAACETVTGKDVRVEPSGNLPSGEYLVGRFRRVEK